MLEIKQAKHLKEVNETMRNAFEEAIQSSFIVPAHFMGMALPMVRITADDILRKQEEVSRYLEEVSKILNAALLESNVAFMAFGSLVTPLPEKN